MKILIVRIYYNLTVKNSLSTINLNMLKIFLVNYINVQVSLKEINHMN
jgi:hypothetical protein